MARQFPRALPTITREQLTELRCCFNLFDIDHSGEISLDEFEDTMKRLGLESDPTYKDLFGDRADKTSNMDFKEFKQIMYYKLYPNHHSVKDLEDAFKYFDTDNSGSISLEEFHLAMCKFSYISKKSAEEIMKDIDEDKNKTLSLEEFKKLLL